ncbi:MAG: hypothetical protein ABSA17_07855 [Rhabdochlamydiaceae bacterium]|jgi:hypothetical protein
MTYNVRTGIYTPPAPQAAPSPSKTEQKAAGVSHTILKRLGLTEGTTMQKSVALGATYGSVIPLIGTGIGALIGFIIASVKRDNARKELIDLKEDIYAKFFENHNITQPLTTTDEIVVFKNHDGKTLFTKALPLTTTHGLAISWITEFLDKNASSLTKSEIQDLETIKSCLEKTLDDQAKKIKEERRAALNQWPTPKIER